MSTSLSKMARELQSIISETDSRKTKPFDSEAEVVKVEDDYVYVHFAGGVDETPVRKTMDANVGDKVQVRVSSGKAWLIGNATAPPTDDKTANKALGQAATAFKSVKQLEDVVDQVTDEIDDISEDLGDLGDYAEELSEALTSTNNHFWVDDNTGAVYVSMADGDATQGYAMRHASSGIVLLKDSVPLTSWTGSGQLYYSDGQLVALYSSEGAIIGPNGGSQISISSDTFSVIGEDGIEQFNISPSTTEASKLITLTVTTPAKTAVSPPPRLFPLPMDTTISYSGRITGSFVIDDSTSGTIFSGTYGEKSYRLECSAKSGDTAFVKLVNNTTIELTFIFSYEKTYEVPIVSSIGTGEFGGNLSAAGSCSIGGSLSVGGDIACANIGLANTTGSSNATLSSGSTWTTLDTSVTLGPGTFILMGHVSFDEDSDTFSKGYRSARIYNVSDSSAYAISTMQTAPPSNGDTYLRVGTIVWPTSAKTYKIQARQGSGSDINVTSQLRWCRII